MALNEPLNEQMRAKPSDTKVGSRINIVEDDDFGLILDQALAQEPPTLKNESVQKTSSATENPSRMNPRTEAAAAAARPVYELIPPGASITEQVQSVTNQQATPSPKPASANTSLKGRSDAATLPEAAPVMQEAAMRGKADEHAGDMADGQSMLGGLMALNPMHKKLRVMVSLLVISLLLGAVFVWINLIFSTIASTQTQIAGDALMHSQRIGKAAPNAMQGNLEAFKQLEESRKELMADLERLARGGNYLGLDVARPSAQMDGLIKETQKVWDRSERAADTILKLKKELTGFGATLQKLDNATPGLLDMTEQITNAKVQSGAPAREISAAGQLSLLTQRMARSSNQFLSFEGVNPGTAFLLGKDVNTFRDITDGFLRGNEMLRLSPTKEGDVRERLHKLQTLFDEYRQSVSEIMANMPKYVAAKQSEQLIFTENEALKQRLSVLQQAYRTEQDNMHLSFWLLLTCIALALLSASGIASIMLQESRQREADAQERRFQAEAQRALSQQQEMDARASNDQIQLAILRLMNELQKVADGDLTVQATVTEDITGAIADSINYTVEELRGLVGRVTLTAEQVTAASTQAQSTSNSLLAASHQQSRDIQETGQSVMAMAVQITDVSRAAIESAEVARLSVTAAEEGATAVGNAIAGMQGIREQIQETSKRIKRLGESSQEIGEITELISDITEQTNVLALNAAIQAASAGEAGRGFSIVAEEVQRLAERSGLATKQIGALVRAIQGDTHDAVAAMERSTLGVVEGARLSDAAGMALAEIRRVSDRLAELIHGISSATEQQATSANGVAQNIQHILTVTERTQEGTQQTAQSVRELSRLAQELRDSVARFRIAP